MITSSRHKGSFSSQYYRDWDDAKRKEVKTFLASKNVKYHIWKLKTGWTRVFLWTTKKDQEVRERFDLTFLNGLR